MGGLGLWGFMLSQVSEARPGAPARSESPLERRGQQLLFRLNMHQDFGDLWDLLQYCVFYIVRNVMALTHRQSSFDDDMQVNIVAKAHFADVAFLKADDS